MGRYRSIQATLIEIALKGITDNQTVTAYKKDCKKEPVEVVEVGKDIGVTAKSKGH